MSLCGSLAAHEMQRDHSGRQHHHCRITKHRTEPLPVCEQPQRRTQMELGSISFTVLCADANLDAAIPKIVGAA